MMTPEPRPPAERPRWAVSTRTTAGPILSTTAAIPCDSVSSKAIDAASAPIVAEPRKGVAGLRVAGRGNFGVEIEHEGYVGDVVSFGRCADPGMQ